MTQKTRRARWISVIAIGLLVLSASSMPFFSVVQIRGDSMNPTLCDGEYWIVARRPIFQSKDDIRGSIVLARLSESFSAKRVVAIGGDHLALRRGDVYIDGKSVAETYRCTSGAEYLLRDWPLSGEDLEIPRGSAFLLGDNRRDSSDSREIDSVPLPDIVGKLMFRVSPLLGRQPCPC